ncbi:MAG: hypothetical protein M1833_007333 [Piccolia ochrophora]|nr:MAG: hypothetical protein M1833_007333 [Piccolia ochrophora]
MPHKHRRQREADESGFDLPPTSHARPLSTSKVPAASSRKRDGKEPPRNRSKTSNQKDDTPKAFARLMQFQSTGRRRSGLDDGSPVSKSSKKRKRSDEHGSRDQDAIANNKAPLESWTVPKIQPGERMSEFGARVDAALPISGLAGKRKSKDPTGIQGRRTRLERKMQKMQSEWREQDKKLKEQREELREEEMDESRSGVLPVTDGNPRQNRKKKKGRNRGVDDDEGDPWDELRKKRGGGPHGLHDVVLCPPNLTKAPGEKFKVTRGARVHVDGIPKTAGSLKSREELAGARMTVIQQYREMMGR